jgi:hypothetical protein
MSIRARGQHPSDAHAAKRPEDYARVRRVGRPRRARRGRASPYALRKFLRDPDPARPLLALVI